LRFLHAVGFCPLPEPDKHGKMSSLLLLLLLLLLLQLLLLLLLLLFVRYIMLATRQAKNG